MTSFGRASKSIEELFDEALGCHKAGQIEDACLIYGSILSRRPNHAGSLHMLGLISYRSGQLDRAAKYMESAIAVDPSNADFWNSLGVISQEARCWEKAQYAFEQAIYRRTLFPEATNNLGAMFYKRRELDRAAVVFRRAIDQQPGYVNARYNLATTLQAMGRASESYQAYMEVLELDCYHTAAFFGLGSVLMELKENSAAAVAFEQALALDPQDSHGSKIRLAALGRLPPPERLAEAFVQQLYESKAETWDQDPGYRGSELVIGAVSALPISESWAALDAGCGTGLCGSALRKKVQSLVGVDLSAAMLEEAKKKAVYDELHQADLLDYMRLHPKRFDLIVSAATLIHFGSLETTLRTAAACLRPRGWFVFTLFSFDDVDPGAFGVHPNRLLMDGGCFAHGSEYLRNVASKTGFRLTSICDAIHDESATDEIQGLLVTLALPSLSATG